MNRCGFVQKKELSSFVKFEPKQSKLTAEYAFGKNIKVLCGEIEKNNK